MTAGRSGRSGRSGRGGPRRGSRTAPSLVTIYWRDIPAQVTATAGDTSVKELLPARFQHAIDRAATVAGLTETHAYVGQWRREAKPLAADPAAAAEAEAARIADEYPKRRLDELVRHGGLAHPEQLGAEGAPGGQA
jgi:hypothetical protein